MFTRYLHKSRRLHWSSISLGRYSFKFRKRHKLQIVVALMSLNILISLSILSQQSKLTSIFDNYFVSVRYKCNNNELLKLLSFYRSSFKDRVNSSSSLTHENSPKSDYYFNGDLIDSNSNNQIGVKPVEFYSPQVLMENREACSVGASSSRRPLFMISLIHSHINNYLRRKTMRETWLSLKKLPLSELYPGVIDASQDYELHFAHLFVIGNDRQRPAVMESIRNESRLFNDVLVIDIEENYKNLIYKHLALVDWVTRNCKNVSYVLKMDDDVLVNIQSLTRHLIEQVSSQQNKFLFCNINQQSLPVRRNTSKWFVHSDTYPFEWYPKYCEGFAYITNLNTIRFMSEQSRRIPRFWIDDVYFTGLLFHGIDDVKWIDFKGHLNWAYYDFWDLGNTLSIYELYAYILKLFNISITDYYKSDHFIILHSQPENEEFNYTMSTVSSNSLGQLTSPIRVSDESIDKSKVDYCNNFVLKFITSTGDKSSNFSSGQSRYKSSYEYVDCLEFVHDRKFILNFYFYEFCRNLWTNSFLKHLG